MRNRAKRLLREAFRLNRERLKGGVDYIFSPRNSDISATVDAAEIRRIKKRIENLEANKNTEFVGWKFDGGEAVINEDKNRLQLLFDEKPSKEQRETLKANGFRRAPSDAAWQRQLNPNAFYAANRIDFIKPENGERPTDLQSKAPKKSEPER